MLTALLLAAWMWDRPRLTACGDTDVHHYYFRATMRQNVPSTCQDDQGQPYPCETTIPMQPERFGSDVPDPGTGATVSTQFDPVAFPELLPLPPRGGLACWPWITLDNPQSVVAVDAAGNESVEGCP